MQYLPILQHKVKPVPTTFDYKEGFFFFIEAEFRLHFIRFF